MDLKQIITLHKDGESNRQIGDLLNISRNTVNNYIKLIKASDHSPGELLAMDNHELGELFTAHTTIVNDRFNQLMTWFDKINQQRNHPGFTLSVSFETDCVRLSVHAERIIERKSAARIPPNPFLNLHIVVRMCFIPLFQF